MCSARSCQSARAPGDGVLSLSSVVHQGDVLNAGLCILGSLAAISGLTAGGLDPSTVAKCFHG